MTQVYVIAPCRTAIGSFNGSLKGFASHDLGAVVLKEALKRANLSPNDVDCVIMGNALQAGQGQNPARQASISAGIPVSVPAMTVNKVCGSGLTAVNLACSLIRAGEANCILAGGMESMSNAPYYLPSLRSGARMFDVTAIDGLVHDGLWDAFGDYHMGITAENIACHFDITREEQDEYAYASQLKAAAAQAAGRFEDEIVTVEIAQKHADKVLFRKDEYIRTDTDLSKIAALRTVFQKAGTVTAANASGINDGAAAMLLVSEEFLLKNNLIPAAKHVAGASCGVEPSLMGLGPVPSVHSALKKSGLNLEQIDLFEVNEAFAVQSLAVIRELCLPTEKVNVNGGAIAIGHPLGASGARISVTLLHELGRRDAKYGLATLCIGGGMGEATIFERDHRCHGGVVK